MNICFIANYHKTDFFIAVAEQLQLKSINHYWITCNKNIYNKLLKTNKKENILYINKHTTNEQSYFDNLKLNELLYLDRSLNRNKDSGLKFLNGIQKPYYDFIKNNSIKFIFGEITWAHEILFMRITKQYLENEAQYLCPHTIRIPTNRFGFFCDEKQSILLDTNKKESASEDYDYELEKPTYLETNNKNTKRNRQLQSIIKRSYVFLKGNNFDPNDPTSYPNKLQRIKQIINIEKNIYQYKKISKLNLNQIPTNKKVLFVALQKQPEASIDVLGMYYENQAVNIINLWRQLEENWVIVIKEHSNAIGDRDRTFYKQLIELPNVYLVKETIDSYDLIKRSEITATVSGTVAYEAALLGKHAITFAPCFFNSFNTCRKVETKDFLNKNILTTTINKNPLINTIQQKQSIIKKSFVGIISDPVSNSECMSKTNINNVSKAFEQVLM